jgi:hypothetical protein
MQVSQWIAARLLYGFCTNSRGNTQDSAQVVGAAAPVTLLFSLVIALGILWLCNHTCKRCWFSLTAFVGSAAGRWFVAAKAEQQRL